VDLFHNVSVTLCIRVHRYCTISYTSFWTFICQTILLCNKDNYMNNKTGKSQKNTSAGLVVKKTYWYTFI